MKKCKGKLQRLLKNRKLRCGGFSAALTGAVILCVLLLGAAADAVESRYALARDLSFNAATTHSEVTDNVLAGLEKDVHIYCVIPAEGQNNTLVNMLERYAAESPHVTYSRESIVKNPVLLTRFSDAIGENEVTGDCLIVHCPDTGRARVLTEDDYYVYEYDMETGTFSEAAVSYEKCVTEAILYVTQDELPCIQILTGHGEMTAADTAVLEETLTSANYLVERVNLQSGVLDPESPLLVLSPAYDFADGDLEKLMDFARAGGDFFFLSQYSDPTDLANYASLLRLYGMEPYPGLCIAMEDAVDSYYGDAPVYLMPVMQETNATLPLLSGGKTLLLLAGARAFRLPAETDPNLTLLPVLMTGDAYIRDYTDGLSVSDWQAGDETGRFPVALWADKMFDDGTVSHAFIMGNATAFTDYWTVNNTDSTAFLLQVVRSLQGKSPVNLDILPKNVLREGLALTSLTPAVIVTVALPLLVLLAAALVLWPRRNL